MLLYTLAKKPCEVFSCGACPPMGRHWPEKGKKGWGKNGGGEGECPDGQRTEVSRRDAASV
eukprot:scaffold10277_cov90-Isochrysis_galbana.AAC.4